MTQQADLRILAYTSKFMDPINTMLTINQALQSMGCKFSIGGKMMQPIKSIWLMRTLTPLTMLKAGGSWYNQYWFAIHLISNTKHQCQAIKYLYKMFNQKNMPQAGDLQARFIPHESIITIGEFDGLGQEGVQNAKQISARLLSSP